MADLKKFRLEVISPERIFYSGEVEMLELTTTEGEIGIYADHIPLTTIIAPGVMTITEAGSRRRLIQTVRRKRKQGQSAG